MNDSLLPSRALRVFSAVASALWWLLVAFWLVLALAWGALHGWIVPRIGDYRPMLETQATRALGVPVHIGAITAHSDGLVPTFELRNVVLQDPQAGNGLRLARVVVALSPRSLWNLGFEQLVVENPQLDVRRTADGRLWVAGMDVSRGGEDERVADWFFRQKEVMVLGGTLRWTDELRGQPTVTLNDVQFVARNSVRRHSLRLDATPPADLGGRFTLRGVFRQPLLSIHPGRWQDWSGQVQADVPSVDLAGLRPYLQALGADVASGRGALRAWADVSRGALAGGSADLALTDVQLRLAADKPPLALASASGRLAARRLPGGFELESRGLQFETADGQRWPGGNFALTWTAADGAQPARGSLRADHLDLDALAGIATRLPLDAGTAALLARHAPRGLVESLQASWEGTPASLAHYEAQGRVTGLALPGAVGLPGVRGASVDFDLRDTGGTAKLLVQDGAIELPGVLQEPVVPLQRLSTEVHWRIDGQQLAVDVKGLEFRNDDAQGHGHASWHTGQGPRGRFPGVIDLQLAIARADGARVWRYLPLAVPADARKYVRAAVLAGRASDGVVRLKGDLRDFPFANRRNGEFRISAHVQGASYSVAPREVVPAQQGQWPVLTNVSGDLLFERAGMQVRNAQGRIAGAPGLQFQADASIPDLETSKVQVAAQVRGPLAESLAVFNATPVAATIGHPLAQATATGAADLRLSLALPLAHIDDSRVQGSLALAGNDLRITPGTPLLARARGTVGFSENGFTVSGGQARVLGGEVRIEGGSRELPAGSREAPAQLRLQGTASAEGLRQARELGAVAGLARRASGAASYSATLGLRPGGVDVSVASDLQGLALDLPAPLGKAADASLPLRFELAQVPGARPGDRIAVSLGRVASVSYVRDLAGPEPRVLRGAIGVGLAPGEEAPLPSQGVLANVQLASFDVDAWQRVLEGLAPPAPKGASSAAAGAGSGGVMDYLPTTMAVRARSLTAQGRTLRNVVVGGSREGLTWRANVDAQELNGYVEYRQPAGDNPGRVVARLARLSIAASTAGEVESLLNEQPSSIPALDVVVDDFELRGHHLGRLEVEAVNHGTAGGRGNAAPEWRLNRLSLRMPEAVFTGTGHWTGAGRARRRTVMNFELDIRDAGLLLARLGMKDVVRRGHGKLDGQVSWLGSPLALDYPTLGGNMAVNVESGQFLKADPGLAKLLGVLSLQSLPRRLTLDFRDVFSEGFAFDFLRGHVNVEQGVASTNNLQMKGVSAAVLMEGKADLARETQDLKVVVVPDLNAGAASLAAAVINPAVGLGTFLAQLFLREPLMRAATQEFHIDGTWTDPRVTRVPRQKASAGLVDRFIASLAPAHRSL